MDVMKLFKEDLIVTGLEAKNDEEVITALGNLLYLKGYVKKSFVKAVIDREKKYPTGLPINEINLAIPHTDAEHVLKPAIALAVLKKPVLFKNMADPHQEVKANLVFAIALNDSHNQPILLQKLMSIFQDEKLLLTIKESQSASSIFDIIKLKFKEENVS